MKKTIFTLIAAFMALTAFAFEPVKEQTFHGNIGSRVEIRDNVALSVPMECSISLSEEGAALSFHDHAGLHVYMAKEVERVNENTWLFKRFDVYLPDGTRGRIKSAGVEDGVLTIIFDPVSAKHDRIYCFESK